MDSLDVPRDALVAPVPDGARAGHARTADGVDLRWLEWGPQEAPPLVMLHGLRSYGATFSHVAAAIASERRCIAPDARGRGGSSWDPAGQYHTEQYVRDLEHLVGTWGLTTFDLLGHSMGGTTAYVFAARHAGLVRSLVIEDILPGSSISGAGATRIRSEVASTPQRFVSRDEARAYWRRLRPNAGQEAIDSRVANTVRAPDGPGAEWQWIPDMQGIGRARLDDQVPQTDIWEYVELLRCPTLIICGGESDFTSASVLERVVESNPRISSAVVPGAGHYVHDDAPDEYVKILAGFLGGSR
jgi:pimeloyl-ACP methyl ester carboxylesterase